ncbi:HupE/UreJ family protein [Terriglobus roseus]|uniref:HupE / UreJ protein n=1 Tax=Terriglobus roseus TaxID=392734 RepID=A0A1G7G3J0_9BACT|nr:HupE/UreJ family protein [Terriglobus roseus]SDE82726.1 HupE / UreJ protein [Terriglobus roseus]
MKWKLAAVIVMCMLLCGNTAWAHRIDEYLQATILSVEANRVHASMRLIPGVLVAPAVIAAIDSDHDGAFSEAEKRAYAERVVRDLSITVNGKAAHPELDAWTLPEATQLRDGLGEIHIEYHVDVPSSTGANRSLVIANHHLNDASVYLVNVEVPQDRALRVVDQKRNAKQSVYELDYEQVGGGDTPAGARRGMRAWWDGVQVASLFRLGMRHIAEGTDHLLFLLVLLLPSPLLAVDGRWAATGGVRHSLLHIVGIVTAFTVGHSLTLTLAAMNVVHVASRPVEVLIAVSILLSAIHALRPIFPGREAWIAAFFGLIHGLAFASTLDRLGLSRWDRVAGILSFNLGIETMQMLVVALVLPSLLLLSRTRAYFVFRIVGAGFACAASCMWIAERLWRVQTPVDSVVNVIARHGQFCAVALFAVSLICFALANRDSSGTIRQSG